MNTQTATAEIPSTSDTQSIAEVVVRAGFEIYQRQLAKAGIPSPLTPGMNLLRTIGTLFNPEQILTFYNLSGDISEEAGDMLCYDDTVLVQAWTEFKLFILRGGDWVSQEHAEGDYPTRLKLNTVRFCDKSSIQISTQAGRCLPLLYVRNWQSGLLDVTGLASENFIDSALGDRLAVLGYQVDYELKHYSLGRLYYHPDKDMADVLVDFCNSGSVHLLVFHENRPASRVVISEVTAGAMTTPTLALWRKSLTTQLVETSVELVPSTEV